MFLKQPMMRKVMIALIPIYFYSLFLYGLQLILLTAVVLLAGIGTEHLLEKQRKKKISEAILVTCTLYLLSLPPQTPLWIAAIGIIFGVLFAKEVFGGFGRNPFNPAITGRLFAYLTFPNPMTYGWPKPGGFALADVVTGATPLALLRDGNSVDLFSHIIGMRSGSFGESMVILIVIAAIYLIVTKTASYEIILSTLASFTILTLVLDFLGVPNALPTLPSLLSGSIMFVAVFIATDPVTAPKKKKSKWIYGTIIGAATVLIRTFSLFPEGTSFGILLGNTFASLLDELFTTRKKVKA